MTYTTTGIVLLKRDFREHDRIYIIYTADHGKMEVLCKAARRVTSKLASHLEPPSLVELVIAKGKIFTYIVGVKRLRIYNNVRCDFDKLNEFSRVAKLFNQEVKLEQNDKHLYQMLENFLNNLNQKADTAIVSNRFCANLTDWTNYGKKNVLGL